MSCRSRSCFRRDYGYALCNARIEYCPINILYIGVIKGSEESIKTEKGFLDRDTYINLSDRSRATFATRREEMYSIFQAYNKRKQECREWDAADRYGHMDLVINGF